MLDVDELEMFEFMVEPPNFQPPDPDKIVSFWFALCLDCSNAFDLLFGFAFPMIVSHKVSPPEIVKITSIV